MKTYTDEIGIGILGAGLISSLHEGAIRELEDVRLAAVCDADADRLATFADLPEDGRFQDIDAMLSSPTVDAVINCLPHDLHGDVSERARRAGKHVLVEKPLAISMSECVELTQRFETAGLVLAPGHVQRFLPKNVAARDDLAAIAGTSSLFTVDRRSSQYRPGTRPGWFFEPQRSGGGILMNVGTHSIDRIVWLTGTHPVRVTARARHAQGEAVETDCVATMEMNDGGLATIVLSGTGNAQVDQVELIGQDAHVTVRHDVNAAFARPEDSSAGGAGDNDVPGAFRAQLENFLGAIRGTEQLRCTAREATDIMAIVEAIYESAERGCAVEVNYRFRSATSAT